MVKINTDATIFANQREFGIGIIIQKFRGHALVAKFQRLSRDVDARKVETIAIKEALLLA